MAVEVTVRFAGTLLDAVVVGPGRSFRLGTAPGVDVAVLGLISFPLVDSAGLVRLPAGYVATAEDGTRLADIAPLRGLFSLRRPLRLAIGAIEITLAAATASPPLARPPLERRLLPYLGVALVAHLALWVTASLQPVPEPPVGPRLVRLKNAPPPLPSHAPPKPLTGTAMQLEEGAMGKRDSGRAEGQYAMSRRGNAPDVAFDGVPGSITAAQIHGLIGTVDLRAAVGGLVGPVHRDEDDEASGFGGAARFDPSTRPGFESVKTGRYATVDHGRAAGDDYHLAGETTIDVELCASAACVATGAIDRASVHSWIAPHAADFRACFDGTARVLVDFTIANGVVHGAHGRGATGACAAAVVSGIAFPHTAGTTRVRYEVNYQRS